jgi:hypothetical protein
VRLHDLEVGHRHRDPVCRKSNMTNGHPTLHAPTSARRGPRSRRAQTSSFQPLHRRRRYAAALVLSSSGPSGQLGSGQRDPCHARCNLDRERRRAPHAPSSSDREDCSASLLRKVRRASSVLRRPSDCAARQQRPACRGQYALLLASARSFGRYVPQLVPFSHSSLPLGAAQ